MKASREKPGARGPGFWEQDRFQYLLLFLILLFTAFLFSGTLRGGFLLWDDDSYVTNNPDIRGLDLQHLKAISTRYYCGNWQPLTMLSYALEYAMAGSASAFLYHLNNLLLHLLNVVLVFFLVRRLLGETKVAAIGSLLFAIHPMRLESVAWIAERKDVLYAFFFLLGLICYLQYLIKSGKAALPGNNGVDQANRKAGWYYFLMLLCFILSGLSKSAAVVFPLVLFCLDFVLRRKYTPALLLEKMPLLAVALFFGYMAI